MSAIIGAAHPAAWLQVPAALLHMIPMNLVLGGACLAALLATRRGSDEQRLLDWLLGVLPAAGLWAVALGLASHAVLTRITAPGGRGDFDLQPSPIGGGPLGAHGGIYGWPAVDLGLLTGLALGALILARRGSRGLRIAACGTASGLLLLAALLCGGAQNADERSLLGEESPFTGAALLPLLSGRPMPFPLTLNSASSIVPRLAHMVLGAVAVAGMIVALRGVRILAKDPAHAGWLCRRGALWFSIPTGVQMAVGFWLLVALPGAVRSRFLGGTPWATGLIVTGILVAVAALMIMTQAGSSRRPAQLVVAGAVVLIVLLTLMTLIREQARHGYLAELSAPAAPAPSTGAIAGALTILALLAAAFSTWLWRALGRKS